MQTRKRTVSETEIHRVVTIRGRTMQARCAACGVTTEMIPIADMAESEGLTLTALRERIGGSGHLLESAGTTWVCRSWRPG